MELAGRPVRLTRHPRARHLRLRVDPGGELHLTLPSRASLASARTFLDEQRGWVERTLARDRDRLGLQRPGELPLLGERRPLAYRHAVRASVSARSAVLASGPTRPDAAAALERWARREVERRAAPIVACEARRLGIEPPRMSIRAQRTRWGSASARTRTLALNWRLLLTTEEALDYVVVHELCHFREMSHAPAFWRLVEELRPGYGAARAWLRTHQAEVLRWSPLQAL